MLTIRKGLPEDEAFLIEHAYRLLEFGPPSWRGDREPMTQMDIRYLREALLAGDKDMEVLIALDEHGQRVGFLHLRMYQDYYTEEMHAHITDIVVIASAEGKGVGRFLLEKADEWARQKNSRWITLNAFENNTHARKVYEKAGYKAEWVKYLKEL